ncbi:MAG: RNA-binding S4 domain-containing protein [Erysipelotrichaceae bacterium]|jgi:ribosomal 50S subunit-recycling heat shock protein|nr:S4 domain-containing protein [Bacilli bacterium]NLV29196.1 RNA-binding S4 domain-containing protein [Erysipelotrichaceae bacterium]HPY79968.1 S4 domain-containing protein [Bacilli bacterium]HQA55962.1 S4 domain-containing protein [Bacilli bacterium]
MRADLVLKQTGIIKRRVIAKALLERGRVSINDKVAKPSSEVKSDDVLTLSLGDRIIKAKITFEVRGRRELAVAELLSIDK